MHTKFETWDALHIENTGQTGLEFSHIISTPAILYFSAVPLHIQALILLYQPFSCPLRVQPLVAEPGVLAIDLAAHGVHGSYRHFHRSVSQAPSAHKSLWVGGVKHTGSGAPKDDVVGRQEVGAAGALLAEQEEIPSVKCHWIPYSPSLLSVHTSSRPHPPFPSSSPWVSFDMLGGADSRSSRCGCGPCRQPGTSAAARGPCSARR